MAMSKEAPQESVGFVMRRSRCAPKRCPLGSLARILLAVVHFLHKLLGLLFVDERQSGQAVLELKSMEKDAVLVVAPCVVDLLIPYNAAITRLPAS